MVTGVLLGVAPARAPRDRRQPERRRRPPARPRLARHALIVAQVAISFVPLIAAGLMVKSFIRLQQVDTGFSSDHVP